MPDRCVPASRLHASSPVLTPLHSSSASHSLLPSWLRCGMTAPAAPTTGTWPGSKSPMPPPALWQCSDASDGWIGGGREDPGAVAAAAAMPPDVAAAAGGLARSAKDQLLMGRGRQDGAGGGGGSTCAAGAACAHVGRCWEGVCGVDRGWARRRLSAGGRGVQALRGCLATEWCSTPHEHAAAAPMQR